MGGALSSRRREPRLELLTGGAGAAQHDVVGGDGVPAPLLDLLDHRLQTVIGERLDLPATVADEVVVVIRARSNRLEAGDPVAEVESLQKTLLGQGLEDAIDAGERHRPSCAS